MSKEEIERLVTEVVSRYLVTQIGQTDVVDSTPLFGEHSILDSMGLVNVVVDIEAELLAKNIEISLTSENAMSRRHSPFRTVITLVDYISELINGQ